MLNKKNRIQSRGLIANLFQEGKTFKGKYLTFKFLPGGEIGPRFAIVISKKISKKAVERNRFKRQIAETLRHRLKVFKSSLAALAILRSATMTLKDLESDVTDFLTHLGPHAE